MVQGECSNRATESGTVQLNHPPAKDFSKLFKKYFKKYIFQKIVSIQHEKPHDRWEKYMVDRSIISLSFLGELRTKIPQNLPYIQLIRR